MILNTFTFVILLLLLVFVVFILVAPVISGFFSLHSFMQENLETLMYGNVTNATQKMGEAYSNVKTVLPWMVVFAFILGVLIYVSLTEIVKKR